MDRTNNYYSECADSTCSVDTKKPMELCHSIVCGMPVHKGTGIKTEKGVVRVHFTRMLCDLANEVYLGCFAIGEPFKIGAFKLCNIATDLILDKDSDTKRKLARWYPQMKPIQLAGWIEDVLDSHNDAREQIEFIWM